MQPRDDIKPVILAGDMSSYPLAREFHEAFGVKSTCIVPEPIKIISTSKIVDVHHVDTMGEEDLREAICAIAHENGDKKVILIANSDAVVERVEGISHDLPDNVRCSLPPHDVMVEASNKITFANMCERYGLDAPHSEIVHVGGEEPIAPSKIEFPLIAKPAESSAEYFLLYSKGFKKVYYLRSQAELDQLWTDLRAEHYSGDFLVQELIGGDDTYVDMITAYVNQRGKVTMFVSAQVLLEDHNPMLLGNPVAMITRPMPELWEKVAHMLEGIGWRGFANFDMKRDPKTEREIFMDFNPRIGANSYYACVGGVNPMHALVADFVDGTDEVLRIDRKGLYSRARPGLVRRYITDPDLMSEYDEVVRGGVVANPMRYGRDSLRSRAIGRVMELNYDRKFAKFYPKPTADAF